MRLTNVLDDTRQLARLVWLAFAALIIVALAFGGYYYWDRYVALGDVSPVELSMSELEHVVRENPDDPEARLALGQTYFQSKKYDDSLTVANQILELYPENDGAMYLAGMSLVQLGRPADAMEPLTQFAEMRRGGEMAKTDMLLEGALYFIGESYLILDQPGEAIPVLQEALEISYTDADAMYQLGTAYARTDQHEKALEQYHNAVRFVPDFKEVYSGMIVSYGALDQLDYVAYARGMEAMSLKDFQTARTHLEYAVNHLPDFMPAYLGAGLAFEEAGDLNNAEAYLSHAVELAPDNFMATNALSRVKLAKGASQ